VVNKPGGTNVTDVLLVHPSTLWPIGTNTVNVAYTDSAGSNYNHNYYYVVAPYVTISTNLWTAPGSGFDPGWDIQAFQSPNTNLFNGFDNSTSVANAAMNGIYGTNVALTGPFVETNVINYASHGDGTVYDAGNFTNDVQFWGMPGRPGVEDNCAMTAVSFIEFPSSGLYVMGVNSDDGFRVSYGDRTSPGISIFEVLAPVSIAGERIGIETSSDIHGFGARLPNTPIFGRCVVTDPLNASTALNNAAAIAGNIALCQRGPGFQAQSLNCFNAGAIAVIGTLGPGDVGQLPSFRGGTQGGITIPCVEISYEDGTNLIANATTTTNSPLVVRVSDDCSQTLGEFQGGRGSSDTLFSIYVPQAGLYPLRLLWENGGGDANCEFFTVDTVTGVKKLINDPGVNSWRHRAPPAQAHFNAPIQIGNTMSLSWVGSGELEYTYRMGPQPQPWRKYHNQNNPQLVPTDRKGVPTIYFRIRSF
jgi:hypothetical protein